MSVKGFTVNPEAGCLLCFDRQVQTSSTGFCQSVPVPPSTLGRIESAFLGFSADLAKATGAAYDAGARLVVTHHARP